MRRPILLFLQTQAEAAGAQEVAWMVASGLEKLGYDVHSGFFYRKTGSYDHMQNMFCSAAERPRTVVDLMKMSITLRAQIRDLRPDAVLTFQHYGNIIGALIARMAGVRRVVANMNTSRDILSKGVLASDWLLSASGAYTRVVANSASTAAEFSSSLPSLRRRTVRIDHGFSPRLCLLSQREARSELGLPLDVVLLGTVGRLHESKNQSAIIKALAAKPNWHLALAGHGEHQGALEELAAAGGYTDRVHFVGEILPAKIGTFLRSLDAFVFASRAESFGLAAVEAAHHGVPVVSHHLDVMREVLSIDGAPCAKFVDCDDTAALQAAIEEVLQATPSTTLMTESARLLEAKYSVDGMVDKYAALLADIGVLPGEPRTHDRSADAM